MVSQPENSVKRRRSAYGTGRGGLCLVLMPSCTWSAYSFPSFPSFAADCSPEPIPDCGAELNLFIACTPSRAWRTAAASQRNTQYLAPPQVSPCGSSPFMRCCKHVALLQSFGACVEHRRTCCDAKPVSPEKEGPAFRYWWSVYINCLLQLGQYIGESLFLTTCSLRQCLVAHFSHPQPQPVCAIGRLIQRAAEVLTATAANSEQPAATASSYSQQLQPAATAGSYSQQPAASQQPTIQQSTQVWKAHRLHSDTLRTVHCLSCTRISQAHLRQRPPQPITSPPQKSAFLSEMPMQSCAILFAGQ